METAASSGCVMKPERYTRHWYLATVAKSGSTRVIPASIKLSNVWNQSRGAVLAEPFPWLMTQRFILLLVIINNQLKMFSWLLSTHDNQLET